MVTAYVFDRERGEDVENWVEVLSGLGEDQVLWIDLLAPSEDEERAAREGLGLPAEVDGDRGARTAEIELGDDFIRVTAVAVSDEEQDPERETVLVDCVIGANWVLTVHAEQVAVIDDFRSLALAGGGGLGVLDAPSFLATLLEWVVTSYSRAFAEIESTLEEFDVTVLRSARGETEKQISVLVHTRSRVGRLRRALAPQREIFATLAHSELDSISSSESAARFEKLTAQVDAALATARDARDAVVSSFDVLILRTEHRTNEIVKILTLASILLLPGALIAGVLGMNVNFTLSSFVHSAVFWIAIVAIVGIALVTLGLARRRRWI